MEWKIVIKKNIKQILSSLGKFINIPTTMTESQARTVLNAHSRKPIGSCYTDNILDISFDLHIIIPSYNSSSYIEQCLDSVLKQRCKYKVHITVINDGSTDNTKQIVENIIENYNNNNGLFDIELINQENLGHSGARNSALHIIRGKYVMFLDSDDVLPPNILDKMLDAAFSQKADILQGSWVEFSENCDNNENIIVWKKQDENSDRISGYPWGKLYKYSVLEHFQFPEGYWYEDTPISFILAALPYKVVGIDEIVYKYRINPNGITATSRMNSKSVDTYWITELCLEQFSIYGLNYDQRAYEYLLRQCMMNSGRISFQNRRVRKAVFVLTSCLISKYFNDFCGKNVNCMWIEDSLRKKQFIKFELQKMSKH